MFSLRLLPDGILIQDRLLGLKKVFRIFQNVVKSEEYPFFSQFCAMFTKQWISYDSMKVLGPYLLQSSFL